jgi:hypothetical protein
MLVLLGTALCLSIYLSIYLSLCSPLLGLGRFFNFLILYKVGRNLWTGDQPVAMPLPANWTAHKHKHTQTSMPWVGFQPTIPAFERAKTVHALDRKDTGIGYATITDYNKHECIRGKFAALHHEGFFKISGITGTIYCKQLNFRTIHIRRRHSYALLFLITMHTGAKCFPSLLEAVSIRVPARSMRTFTCSVAPPVQCASAVCKFTDSFSNSCLYVNNPNCFSFLVSRFFVLVFVLLLSLSVFLLAL